MLAHSADISESPRPPEDRMRLFFDQLLLDATARELGYADLDEFLAARAAS